MDENKKTDGEAAEENAAEVNAAADTVSGDVQNEEAAQPIEEIKEKKKIDFGLVRCITAAALAVILLCVTGFGAFKLMFGGADLTAGNYAKGKYLTFNVDTIIDYLAEDFDTDGETVTGRYAIVPVDGSLAIVHLPQRYLESGDTIAVQTYYALYGYTTADQYFVASGAVKAAPEEIASQFGEWFNSNILALYQMGFVTSVDEPAFDLMVEVDSTGLFGDAMTIVISAIAGLCLVWAVIELVMMKRRRAAEGISVEIFDMNEEDGELLPEEPSDMAEEAAEEIKPEETEENSEEDE